jgi:cell division protein FtsB
MTRGRRLVLIIVGLALLFALTGGEYSTLDWLSLRRQERDEIRRVAELKAAVDSLERDAVAIETDPVVQERVAREEFGMLRRGEFAYQLLQEEGGGNRE